MKTLDIAIIFFAIVLILMLSITMISKIERPESGTEEYATWINLTAIITLMYNAWYAVLLVLLAVMLISVFALFKRGGGSRW